jgi:hypothetical protein
MEAMNDVHVHHDWQADVDPRTFAIATEESAHELVADYYSLDARPLATKSRGVCLFSQPPSPLADAAIAWAGVVGRAVLDARTPDISLPDLPLNEGTIVEWCREALRLCADCSPVHDLYEWVRGWRSDGAEGAWTAFQILRVQEKALRVRSYWLACEALARRDAGDDRAVVAAFKRERQRQVQEAGWAEAAREFEAKLAAIGPLPRKGFPASLEEFVREVVVGKGGHIEPDDVRTICNFFRDKVRQSGWHESSVERGLNILMQENKTLDQVTWTALASEYKNWSETRNDRG